MSAFDKSFNKPSGCLGVCNENGDRQSPILALQNPLEDDLKTSEDRQKKQEIDNMLSHAMKALTFEERQEQQEILHGVDEKIAEEETYIEASLQKLETQLSKVKSHTIYEMAEKMDPTYARARAFQIMFLRANRYDVKESAENMLRFFEMKRELFGAKKLVKDITLEDLDDDDIAALKTGFLQIAGKDSAGRVIVVNFPGLRGNMALQNELRMRYYILMSILAENQRSSIVPTMWCVGDMKDRFGGSGFFENAKLSTIIPNYKAACHMCIDEAREYLIQKAVLTAAPVKLRSRSRLHFGSQTECLYHLSTYGIPQDILPLDPNTGRISLKRHLQWVQSRFALEKDGHSLSTITPPTERIAAITNPGDNDVLVGTGKKSNSVGNQRFRALVKDLSPAYASASKEGRKDLVNSVINSVRESGGRFLKEENVDGWNVVWHEMPKEKFRVNVAQAFRNSYRRRKTAGNA